MLVSIIISTEQSPEYYLIDTDNIQNSDLKNAIEFCSNGVGKSGHNKSFGQYEVIRGEIIQQGYAMNSELSSIQISGILSSPLSSPLPEITVISDN